MVANDKDIGSLSLPNTLELSTDHTVRVVGHLLRRHYVDSLDPIVPEDRVPWRGVRAPVLG